MNRGNINNVNVAPPVRQPQRGARGRGGSRQPLVARPVRDNNARPVRGNPRGRLQDRPPRANVALSPQLTALIQRVLAVLPAAPAANPVGGDNQDPPPNGPLPPVVPPAPVPPAPHRRVYVGYLKASYSWQPHVILDSRLHKFCKQVLNADCRMVPGTTPSQHPLQAMERTVAVISALGFAYSRGYRHLLNVYSDMRESNYNANFNKEVAPNPDGTVGDIMHIHRYCPVIVHKDRMRHPTNVPFDDLVQMADSFLYVDIYQQHNSATNVFDPQYVAEKLLSLPNGVDRATLFWIGRKFYGDAGVVPVSSAMVDNHGKVVNTPWAEGAWRRTQEGKIQFKSSPSEGMEYEHDPCDWIWQSTEAEVYVNGHRYTLRWTQLRVINTMYVLSFGLHPYLPSKPSPWFTYDKNIEQLDVSPSNWWQNAIRAIVPTSAHKYFGLDVTVPVYTPYLQQARAYLHNKKYAQYHLHNITYDLNEQLSYVEFNVLHTCFPELNPSAHLTNIATSLYSSNSESRLYMLQDVVTQHGSNMSGVNQLLTAFGTTPLPDKLSWLTYVGFAGIALGALFALKRKSLAIHGAASVLTAAVSNVNRESVQKVVDALPLYTTGLSNVVKSIVSTPSLVRLVQAQFDWQNAWNLLCDGAVVLPVNWRVYIPTLIATCGVAPALEEYLKRRGLRDFLPWFEFFTYCYAYQNPYFWAYRAGVVRMHYWFADAKTYWQAVKRHAAFNFVVWNAELIFSEDMQRVLLNMSDSSLSGNLISGIRQFWRKVDKADLAYTITMSLLIPGCYRYLRTQNVKNRSYYDMWRELYYNSQWSERPIPTRDVPSLSSAIDDWAVPTSHASVPTSPINSDHYMTVKNWIPLVERSQTYFYHLLPTCVPGYVPATNYHNLNASISSRMLAPPPMAPDTQRKVWMKLVDSGHVGDFTTALTALRGRPYHQMHPDTWEENVDKWLEHFVEPDKIKKYAREIQKIRDGRAPHRRAPRTTEIFLKSNEMLMGSKDGKMILKPRYISNVSPWFQALLGPYVYKFQSRLKKTCAPRHAGVWYDPVDNAYYSICYGGCAYDIDLSMWMDDALGRRHVPPGQNGISIMVSGDDCGNVLCNGDDIILIETDFSNYDASQSFGPLYVQRLISVIFYGLPAWVAKVLYECAGSNRIVIPKIPDVPVFVIICIIRWIRHSGGLDTSCGNSCITQFAWFYVYRMLLRSGKIPTLVEQDVVDLFATIGFKVKVKITRDPQDITFLKGMWFRTNGYNVWAPLPSRILKAGKSLRDPRILFRVKDKRFAARLFLSGIASGHATYLQVPILRAFVTRFHCALEYKWNAGIEFNPYTTVGSKAYSNWPVDDDMMQAICKRYKIERSDIERVERLILESHELTFLSDPVFVALWEADYV